MIIQWHRTTLALNIFIYDDSTNRMMRFFVSNLYSHRSNELKVLKNVLYKLFMREILDKKYVI